MNILEALEVALPDLPAQSAQRRYPKLDPRVISREHVEQGERVVLAKMPGSDVYLRFTPDQWRLLDCLMANGLTRRLPDLAHQQANLAFDEEDVRSIAASLEGQGDLFYKTPLEKNITLDKK